MENHSLLSRARQSLRFDGLWWRKFAYLGCVYGPEWWKQYSPPAIAAILFAVVGRNRAGAIANMERILAPVGRRRAAIAALRMFSEFAHCLTETMEYYGPRPKPIRLDLPEHDPLAEALREGRGAVVVTGHFGNWDIAAKTLCEYGRPINIVMGREINATTNEYVRAVREHMGVRVLYSDTSVFSSLNMIRALRENEIVALQLDRMLGPGGARLIPFFGAPAPFPAGPFALARLAGAPLIPVFIPRLGTRHYAALVPGEFRIPRAAGDAAALLRYMQAVVTQFEAVVRAHPTQWFQFAPFWPTTSTVASVAPLAAAAATAGEAPEVVDAVVLREEEVS
jgi:lauroyl/myristoyl acyltransferase